MIKPKIKVIENIATLHFTTHFGELRTYCVRKQSNQLFHLCYTGIDKITKYYGSIRAIWPKYVEVNMVGGNILRACYGEKLSHGQQVYMYEFFRVDQNMEYNWVISSREIEDDRMIYINLDILTDGAVVERLRIDPYFGRSKVISFKE